MKSSTERKGNRPGLGRGRFRRRATNTKDSSRWRTVYEQLPRGYPIPGYQRYVRYARTRVTVRTNRVLGVRRAYDAKPFGPVQRQISNGVGDGERFLSGFWPNASVKNTESQNSVKTVFLVVPAGQTSHDLYTSPETLSVHRTSTARGGEIQTQGRYYALGLGRFTNFETFCLLNKTNTSYRR